ncbi:hypothetical protein Vretimale_15977 [Volvox reticuliferus]|uniref:Uncharacterized protein n=1 Tax=Volvox reticuliferus TaxID=1737510 RepID=A0A8J4CJH7_9CHLO|nr:hypothetical protein Vretifemale_13042 [Volvox reticuliferus]GIM12681.1 hypothetical protein Vretimale_15977 [Volvox reticuliferus]
MMINFIAYGSKSITVESVVPANRVRKPRVWRSAPSKPRNTCPSNSQHRAASANTSLPKPFATEQRATTPAEEAISWDCIYVGRMPLVGFEAVSAMMLPAVTLLPATLSQWFPLHSFLALGSSRSPEECMVIDFLPERPTHPTTALALASGGSVPGQLRVRRLRGWVRGASVRTRCAWLATDRCMDLRLCTYSCLALVVAKFVRCKSANISWLDTAVHLKNI